MDFRIKRVKMIWNGALWHQVDIRRWRWPFWVKSAVCMSLIDAQNHINAMRERTTLEKFE